MFRVCSYYRPARLSRRSRESLSNDDMSSLEAFHCVKFTGDSQLKNAVALICLPSSEDAKV